jgi:nucleoside-diphosphate-sugar epimerase
MKVVVIGGSGKIGQWIVRELLDDAEGRQAHEVTVFDRVAGPDAGRVRYLTGDHRDLGQVVGAVAGAEAIIHLAATILPPFGTATNDVLFENNVLGAFNVHEAAWRLGIRRVVSTSSGAILGWVYCERPFPPAYLPIDEDHPCRPQDPYGLSKVALEATARSFTDKCGMETVVLRPSAVQAPDQMARLARSGGRPPGGFDTYTYVDVRDLARAYRLAVERPIDGHVVLWTVADDSIVAEPLSALLPRLLPAIADMARTLNGTQSAVTTARSKAVLGWQAERSWRRPDA